MHKSGENIEMLSFCILKGNEKKWRKWNNWELCQGGSVNQGIVNKLTDSSTNLYLLYYVEP